MPPPLPRELIEHILREEKPSKPDLAKICLLNSSFLDFGRRLLYRSVQVTVFAQIEGDSDYDSDEDSDGGGLCVLQYLDDKSAGLVDALDTNRALAALVKTVGFEQYDTVDNFAGGGSSYSAEDSASLILDALERLPNVKSLKLPSYIDGYPDIYDWYTTSPDPHLEYLDAGAAGSGALRLLGSFQDVKHLSFTSKEVLPIIAPTPFRKELNNFRLESLYIARPDKDMQAIFNLLTASSLSTLRTLRLPWLPHGWPADLSLFTSLASLELSDLSSTSSKQLVPLLDNPPTLSRLPRTPQRPPHPPHSSQPPRTTHSLARRQP